MPMSATRASLHIVRLNQLPKRLHHGVPALLQAPGHHRRSQLFDVMAGAQLGDRLVKRPCRTGDQLGELLLVVLVPGRGDQKDHAGRRCTGCSTRRSTTPCCTPAR
jgi:hypothetical protein